MLCLIYMKLYIDTTKNSKIEIFLKERGVIVVRKEFEARFSQAEKLLPKIEEMFNEKAVKLGALEQIRVNSKGSSFTALRIGVVTANSLAYSLGISVKNFEGESEDFKGIELVKPEYDREPDITSAKAPLS